MVLCVGETITVEEAQKAGAKNIDILIKGLPISGDNGNSFFTRQDADKFLEAVVSFRSILYKDDYRSEKIKEAKRNIRGKKITTKEAAMKLGCDIGIIFTLIKHGLPSRKRGRGYLIDPDILDQFIDKNKELIKSLMPSVEIQKPKEVIVPVIVLKKTVTQTPLVPEVFISTGGHSSIRKSGMEGKHVEVKAMDNGCREEDFAYAVGLSVEEVRRVISLGMIKQLNNGITDSQNRPLLDINSAKEFAFKNKNITINFNITKGMLKVLENLKSKKSTDTR
jgi:hypothetical protein